jgi:nucleoside-diphosphate-sugar epimerase
MRILIIGGTGFIGTHVVRHLAVMGHEIRVFHRGQTAAELPSGVYHLLGEYQNLSHFTHELKYLAPVVVLDVIPATE